MLKNLRTFHTFTKNAQKHTLNRQTQLKTYKDIKNKIKLIFTHSFTSYGTMALKNRKRLN